MRATLDRDIILKVGLQVGVEIGRLIPGVPLTQQRFDGTKVVDLATFNQMWIARVNGVFSFHAIQVPGSQLVNMTWADRKRVVEDPPGTFRVLSQAEWDQKQAEDATDVQHNRALRGEMISLIQNTSFADLQSKVDTIFADHTPAQRTFLLQLARIVLYKAKKEIAKRR